MGHEERDARIEAEGVHLIRLPDPIDPSFHVDVVEAAEVAKLVDKLQRQRALLRAIEEERRDPGSAIVQADILAGEALFRAHWAESRIARAIEVCETPMGQTPFSGKNHDLTLFLAVVGERVTEILRGGPCCCHAGAAVSGETPEFGCAYCPRHLGENAAPSETCKRHRKLLTWTFGKK